MTFEEWFNEIENYSLRGERFYTDLDVFGAKFREDGPFVHIDAYESLVKWLKAAYEVGQEQKMSEEYKRGYRDGFNDGHRAGAASGRNIPEWPNVKPGDPMTASVVCPECGMEWKGAMGYVCPNMRCPVQPKVTSWSRS